MTAVTADESPRAPIPFAVPIGAPFLFPLLAKLCLRNLRAIVLVQSALAAAAWLFLARTVASRMHRPAARVFAFTTLLLLALSPVVLMWNTFIATEAFSNMLLCVAIALFVRLTGGTAGRHDFALFAVVLAALACTRDTYAVVLLVVAVIAGAVALVRRDLRPRDRALLLGIGVVAFLVVPHFMVAWHGDALETDRHIISAATQLRIVQWIVTALSLDAVLEWRAKWSQRALPPAWAS